MSDNIKIYKFLFKAHITKFDLKANISSPLIITWKRSNETATSEPVQMVSGKAQIDQTLTLPVNMYFQLKQQKFQQKKSAFSFTMRSPKGDKQAGVIYVDLAQQINDKVVTLDKTYTLQKCPVKNSQVHIQITGQCIGEKDHDNMSQDSFMMQNNNPSSLSIQSHYVENKQSKVKQSSTIKSDIKSKQNQTPVKNTSNKQDEQKDKKIRQLQYTISQLQKQNKKMSSQLVQQRQLNKKTSASGDSGEIINTLKQQILKGKSIQQKLQSQIQNYRQQNIQNQNQLQKIRQKMDKIYDALCHQFGIQQL